MPGFGEDQSPPSGAGIVLVPWPNRIRDGKWSHDGVEHQLAITEPKCHNAIHGLLRYTAYTRVDRERDSVDPLGTVYPQLGYPFLLGHRRALRARRRRAARSRTSSRTSAPIPPRSPSARTRS